MSHHSVSCWLESVYWSYACALTPLWWISLHVHVLCLVLRTEQTYLITTIFNIAYIIGQRKERHCVNRAFLEEEIYKYMITSGMLILVLVLVLKDFLRTFFKSLSLSWSLWVRSLSLSWSLGVRSLSLSWSLGSGPCPYPGPCGLVLVLVLVFSPYKDLFPLFHYSDLFA